MVGLLLGLAWGLILQQQHASKTTLGETARVTELDSNLTFSARVDTGAAVSSIHCVEMHIADESDEPRDNVGKPVELTIGNGREQYATINTTIADYAQVRTSDATTHRYYVRLRLRCADVEKETLVTLKDRTTMRHKLLLGREFLASDFVVDVSERSPQ